MVLKTFANGVSAPDRGRDVTGRLSGATFHVPDVSSGYPSLRLVGATALDGLHLDPASEGFEGLPDVRSHRLKLGLLIPSTNTSMESELWSLIRGSQPALAGVGLHTANVVTPKPGVGTPDGLRRYRDDFLSGLETAVEQALQAEPQYLILGMSLEHILETLEQTMEPVERVRARSGLGVSAWHDAVRAATGRLGVRRIAVLTPFDAGGNRNARRFFEDLGLEVCHLVGMGCASTIDIAHVPDWLKEKVIREELLTGRGRAAEAVVQCGTNFSMCDVAERLEGELGIPILGINAALLWHALRELGVDAPVRGGGRLLAEH